MEAAFIDKSIPEEVLEHYGIPRKSGRYKWGSGENPYHHGASSPFGRLKERRKQKRLQKTRRAALEKAREAKVAKRVEAQNKEEYEKRKKWAIEKGTATDIAPFINDMSKEEFVRARERLQEKEKFMELIVKESPAGRRAAKAARMKDSFDTAIKYVNSGVGGWNTFARVHNGLSKGNEWPVIPSGGKTLKQLSELYNPGNAGQKEINEFNNLAKKKKK